MRWKGDWPGAHLTARGTGRRWAGERSRRRRGGCARRIGGRTRRGDGFRRCRRVVIWCEFGVGRGNRPARFDGGSGHGCVTVAEHLVRGHVVDRLADAPCGGDPHRYPSGRCETFRVPQSRSDDSNGLPSDNESSGRAQQSSMASLHAGRHRHGEIVSSDRPTPIVNR